MASEFDLIHKYFFHPAPNTVLGVGDDAALVSIAPGMELAVSTDMLVSGVHFFHDADASQLGWKSLAVNISDMAAMSAQPRWATLAIALPDINERWLAAFAGGFFACADKFGVDLIGGDTTRGPLTINVQIMGEVPSGKAMKRSGAKVGDEIWVSGVLGDAALALNSLRGDYVLSPAELEACLPALHTPQPRVELGLELRGLANSAIDISDGLLADLGHILEHSNCGAEIHLIHVPHSKTVSSHFAKKQVQEMVLAGGEDYELCFTASPEEHQAIVALGKKLRLSLSCIGRITANNELIAYGLDGGIVNFKRGGFDHFANV